MNELTQEIKNKLDQIISDCGEGGSREILSLMNQMPEMNDPRYCSEIARYVDKKINPLAGDCWGDEENTNKEFLIHNLNILDKLKQSQFIVNQTKPTVTDFPEDITDEDKAEFLKELEVICKKETLPIFLSESSKQLSSVKFRQEKRNMLIKAKSEAKKVYQDKYPNHPNWFAEERAERWFEANLIEKKNDILLEEDLDLDMDCNSAQLPTYKWLVKDLGLCAGAVAIMAGQAGKGKTMLAQNLAICVASGLPFLNTFPIEKGEVVHLDFDRMGRTNTHIRYMRIAKALGVSPKIKFASLKYKLDSIEFDEEGNGIREYLTRLMTNKKLIIIDSLRAGTEGDENDSAVRNSLDMISDISEKTSCIALIIAHSGRDDSEHAIRGSSAIDQAAAQILAVKSKKGSGVFTVSCEKGRIKEFDPFTYHMFDGEGKIEQWNASEKLHFDFMNQCVEEVKEEKKSLEDRILEALKNTTEEKPMPLAGEKGVGLEKTVGGQTKEFTPAKSKLLQDKLICEGRIGKTLAKCYWISSENK